jgi:hypothetical protein
MTIMVERVPSPTRASTLRTLAGVETRRYAKHPLFLIGSALLGWVMFYASDTLGASAVDATMLPAFFLGLLGVFVGHQLTRSTARSADAVEASPADGVTRTAALCLACLVPGLVALGWVAWMYVAISVWPIPDSGAISSADRAAMLFVAVVYAVGGPLVGVMVGRWTRFPGAGLVAAVVLVGWSMLGTVGLLMPASRIGSLVSLNAPFTTWTSADGRHHEPYWVAGGSPWWYLAYLTLLCGLAATAAMLHEASGAQRSRLVRVLVTLAVLAIAGLALAAASDPTRPPL